MNPHLSALDVVLTWVVSCLAATAGVVQLMGRRVSQLQFRTLQASTAALAFAFAAAYQFLLWSDVRPAGYQTLLRGMGLVAWPLVWIGPVWLRLRLVPHVAESILSSVEERLADGT